MSVTHGEPISRDDFDGLPMLGGRVLRALAENRMSVAIDARALDDGAIRALPIADYHVLRDVAARLDVVAHDAEELGCRNCDETLVVDVADEVPVEHFAKRFAKDAAEREAQGTTLPATLHLPEPLSLGRKRTSVLTMGPVTVDAAIPLWAAVHRPGWTITPAIVRAMGIRAAGEIRDPKAIAAALDAASDRVWDALGYAFDVLHYPAALVVPYVCPRCGARNDLETPQPRELEWSEEYPDVFAHDAKERAEHRSTRRERARAPTFPDAVAFERTVERITAQVYEAKGVRNIAIRVETGPPAVDDGGEPLLGSYEPIPPTDTTGWEFLITVYYETFQRMHHEDGPYDLEAELRETIEHEVDHHLAHLRGDDPVDREEREEIRRDILDTYGRDRLTRRAILDVLKLALPLLLLALLVLLYLGTGSR